MRSGLVVHHGSRLRARGNLAVAEIISSTTKEVCELWNGREVVRCMGSAPVAEFPSNVPIVRLALKTKRLRQTG